MPSAAVAANPIAFIMLMAPLLTTNEVKPRAADIPTAFAIASFRNPHTFPAMRGVA